MYFEAFITPDFATSNYATSCGVIKSACLFFHGFPAGSIHSFSHETDKNRDLARLIHLAFGIDCFVFHYKGFGQNRGHGQFSFIETISEAKSFFDKIEAMGYQKFYLVGHSWGGLVSLNLYHDLNYRPKIQSMILLSPFSQFPLLQNRRMILEYVKSEVPYIFIDKTIDDYLLEIEEVAIRYNPIKIIPEFALVTSTIIFQAAHDNEVSPESSLVLTQLLGLNCVHLLVDTDHAFSKNRKDILAKIIEAIRDKKIISSL